MDFQSINTPNAFRQWLKQSEHYFLSLGYQQCDVSNFQREVFLRLIRGKEIDIFTISKVYYEYCDYVQLVREMSDGLGFGA